MKLKSINESVSGGLIRKIVVSAVYAFDGSYVSLAVVVVFGLEFQLRLGNFDLVCAETSVALRWLQFLLIGCWVIHAVSAICDILRSDDSLALVAIDFIVLKALRLCYRVISLWFISKTDFTVLSVVAFGLLVSCTSFESFFILFISCTIVSIKLTHIRLFDSILLSYLVSFILIILSSVLLLWCFNFDWLRSCLSFGPLRLPF
jgi:hypothetical protein